MLSREEEALFLALRSRRDAALLAAQTSYRGEPADGLVEVIRDLDEITRVVRMLQRNAQHEVLGLVRPPFINGDNSIQQEAMAAGVTYRVIYERSALELSNSATLARRFIADGEQARAAPRVPLKMMIVDGQHAVIPLGADEPGQLLLRAPMLVDALAELFEERWARATPLHLGDEELAESPMDLLAPADTQLLSLLLSGLPDKSVAHRLGISIRTLQRRLSQLMAATGTTTRMQLAWHLAQRDLL